MSSILVRSCETSVELLATPLLTTDDVVDGQANIARELVNPLGIGAFTLESRPAPGSSLARRSIDQQSRSRPKRMLIGINWLRRLCSTPEAISASPDW